MNTEDAEATGTASVASEETEEKETKEENSEILQESQVVEGEKREKKKDEEEPGKAESLMEFDPKVREEGKILEEWLLQESATQLTFHGLIKLLKALNDGELAVFFRNNHFATIFKRQNQLYLLVTDEGYLHVDSVVWELLNEVRTN